MWLHINGIEGVATGEIIQIDTNYTNLLAIFVLFEKNL